LPENHECTFELKHTPVTPITPRETRPRYQETPVRSPTQRGYDRRRDKEMRKYLRQQRRQQSRQPRGIYQSNLTGMGTTNGTTFIIVMIVIFSITAMILGFIGFFHLVGFSVFGLLNLWLWIIFTAAFVSYSAGLFGLFFLFILIIFLYNISRNVELRFGTKFLIRLYIFCTALTAIFYILIRLALGVMFPINSINIIPIGLATGAILGLISFNVYFNPKKEMMLFCFFVPVKMKGRILLIVLILFRVIPGLLFGIIISPAYFALYFPDLGGILASYLVFYVKFKRR